MSAYDAPQRSSAGRTATAVLLAVAVLAVLGSVLGYVLGSKANDAKANAKASEAPTGGPATVESPAAPKSAAAGCPDFMQQAAGQRGASLPLTLRLHVVTDKKSEVWVCVAGDGKLWYQGHAIRTAKYPDEVPVEGVNGLLLDRVNGIDQNRYLAINSDQNGETRYTVSTVELIVDRNGKKSTEKVVATS
jgi:hypothetical protein